MHFGILIAGTLSLHGSVGLEMESFGKITYWLHITDDEHGEYTMTMAVLNKGEIKKWLELEATPEGTAAGCGEDDFNILKDPHTSLSSCKLSLTRVEQRNDLRTAGWTAKDSSRMNRIRKQTFPNSSFEADSSPSGSEASHSKQSCRPPSCP